MFVWINSKYLSDNPRHIRKLTFTCRRNDPAPMVGILVKSVKWGVGECVSIVCLTSLSPNLYQFGLKLVFIIWLELLDHEMLRDVRRSQLKQLKPKGSIGLTQQKVCSKGLIKDSLFRLLLCRDIFKMLVSAFRTCHFFGSEMARLGIPIYVSTWKADTSAYLSEGKKCLSQALVK